MSTVIKRKDNKGRVLNEGERQKSNGLYEYRYYDMYNNRRSISSWRLTMADPVPKGKKFCEPLRELEMAILADKHDSIDTAVSKSATLNNCFDVYIKEKVRLKPSTKQNYIYMYDRFVRKTLGNLLIKDITYTVIKKFYNDLIEEKGLKPNSMETIHTVLNPVFDDAVADNVIRANPCPRAMKKIRKSDEWESRTVNIKRAMTATQQKLFVDFMRGDISYERWVNVITVLLGTGMRIGECLGLTWSDVDFTNNTISVNHNLIYRKWEDGKCCYRVMTPKTKKGIRQIPMFDEVREALLTEKEMQETIGTADTVIDGYRNWVFTNRYGTVLSPRSVNEAIGRILRDYNEYEKNKAMEESRTPQLLPHMTNHLLRHSFCTRLVEESCKPGSKINLKLIQEIMGHADFSTTMDIYTDINENFKKETVQALQGDIYL